MAAPPKFVFIMDMTRTRSNLFFRYIQTNPVIESMWHPYMGAAIVGPEGFYKKYDDERGDGIKSLGKTNPKGIPLTYEGCTEALLNARKEANDNGKIFITNEHCTDLYRMDLLFSMLENKPVESVTDNPTCLPPSVWDEITPIFVTRNPIFSVPSNMSVFKKTHAVVNPKPSDKLWGKITDMRFQRQLFEIFRKKLGRTPIVIDGDDTVWRTQQLGDALSRALNIDPGNFSVVWDPVPEDKRSKSPLLNYFLKTINDSKGVEPPTPTPPLPDLDKAHKEWVEEFGAEWADDMKSTVERNMPHYEYLRQFSIVPLDN